MLHLIFLIIICSLNVVKEKEICSLSEINSRASGSYHDFLDRGLIITRKLLNRGFILVKLKSSFRKFYGHYHDLINRYGISVSQMTTWYFPFVVFTIRFFPHSWRITGFENRKCLHFLSTWIHNWFLQGFVFLDL